MTINTEDFIEEAKRTREEFAGTLGLYSVTDNKVLRTRADTLLIMYDLALEYIAARIVDENLEYPEDFRHETPKD